MIDSYEKLTIAKYRELLNLEKSEDEMENLLDILSVLSDEPTEVLLKLPIDDFKDMVAKTAFLKERPKISDRCPSSITIKGVKYNVEKDVKKMNVGQYIDYKQYFKEDEDLVKNLHYIMTIFIIPVGKKYGDGYDVNELAEIINDNMSVTAAIGISNFFFRKSEKSIKCFLTYLLWKMRRTAKKEKNPTVKAAMEKAIAEIADFKDLLKDGFGLIGALGSEKYMDAALTKFSTLT